MATVSTVHCDIRVWSGDCLKPDAMTESEKYLCKTCGKIDVSEHRVRHDFYSYVSGDYQKLS